MPSLTSNPLDFEVRVALGLIKGVGRINKFGRCKDNIVSTQFTDIWNGANVLHGLSTWIAPTAARIHALVSTNAQDNPAGNGAGSVLVQGLTAWNGEEESEVITMDGLTPVNTLKSYVVIYRVVVIPNGGNIINEGTITATAAVDGTITALIGIAEGRTQMAIYALPRGKTILATGFYASVNQKVSAAVDVLPVINTSPDTNTTLFIDANNIALNSQGSTHVQNPFKPYRPLKGPAIIKLVAKSSANGVDVSGGFNAYIVDDKIL